MRFPRSKTDTKGAIGVTLTVLPQSQGKVLHASLFRCENLTKTSQNTNLKAKWK